MIEFLPTMKSDISLYYKDKILIIDTKYYGKIMQTNSNSNNMYQIFTYVKNKDYSNSGNVSSSILLYAKTEEDNVPDNDFLISGNQIGVKTLDMNTDFSNIAKQLNILAVRYLSN